MIQDRDKDSIFIANGDKVRCRSYMFSIGNSGIYSMKQKRSLIPSAPLRRRFKAAPGFLHPPGLFLYCKSTSMYPIRLLLRLALIISATFAYNVTTPSNSQGWTSKGPQPLVLFLTMILRVMLYIFIIVEPRLIWQRVDTDPTTFAVVLVNQVIHRVTIRFISPTSSWLIRYISVAA